MERTESNQEQRKNDKGNRLGLPSVPRQYDHSTCNFMNDTLGFLLATLHGTSTTAGIIDLESDASCSGNAGTIRTFHLVIPRVSLLLVTTLGTYDRRLSGCDHKVNDVSVLGSLLLFTAVTVKEFMN